MTERRIRLHWIPNSSRNPPVLLPGHLFHTLLGINFFLSPPAPLRTPHRVPDLRDLGLVGPKRLLGRKRLGHVKGVGAAAQRCDVPPEVSVKVRVGSDYPRRTRDGTTECLGVTEVLVHVPET